MITFLYGAGLPHSAQNLPMLPAFPQAHVHSEGMGLPHSAQNLPVLPAFPQEHVHSVGWGLPHSAQNLPVLPAFPQAHVQPATGAACGAAISFWYSCSAAISNSASQ
jgi:hypothetical protein